MMARNDLRRRTRIRSRCGATTVEFALTVPIFFAITMAIFEFGWMNVIRHTADNAAYEATRLAIVPGASRNDAIAEANRILSIVGTRGATIQVSPQVLTENTNEITVTIDVPAAQNGIIFSTFFSSTTFRSSSKMLTERPRRN